MPKKRPSSQAIEEFKKLFWEARTEHARNRADNSTMGEAEQKALSFAEAQGWAWGEPLLRASRLSVKKETADEALEVLASLEIPAELEGHVLHMQGYCYSMKGDHDLTIEFYQKALDTPGYDWPGSALNNMGLAYYNKNEFDRAIEFYQKALGAPGCENLGGILHKIGRIYSRKKDYDRAIEFYDRALNIQGIDGLGNVLNNMGIVHSLKGDHDRAIEFYQKALDTPGYDRPHLTRNNLANSLRAASRLDEAEAQLNQVLEEPDTEDEHRRARVILELIKQQRRNIAPSPEDEAEAKQPVPGDEYAARMLEKVRDRTTKYDEYIGAYEPTPDPPNELEILRGWSSAVTLLEGATGRKWPGGGYFLRWRGKGLVIDPGFDFLDNFHEAGYHILDVHAVAVSHDHPDHNGDLRSLDDLCYEIYRNSNNPRPEKEKKTLFMVDDDSYKLFPNQTADHRGTLCRFERRGFEDKNWFGGKRNEFPFHIEHFPVHHGEDVPGAQGFRIVLFDERDSQQLVIGYTGDTKYFPDLAKHLKGVDILIAHSSQPDANELVDPMFEKEIHLGYNGVTNLVKEVNPKLTLVGEFWAGIADLRIDLVKGIRKRSGVNTIFPAGLGLKVNLDEMKIPCTHCHQNQSPEDIRIAPPQSEFGNLSYLCADCMG